MSKPSDTQVGGGHYKSMAIQPAEYCHKNALGYMESRAITYLSRWRNKNGVEDLEKARHCIDLLLEFESDHEIDHTGRSHDESQTRRPHFTGEPPSWDDAPDWVNWITQDLDGEYRGHGTQPRWTGCYSWWLSSGGGISLSDGPCNPNWKHAIEPRPETHK